MPGDRAPEALAWIFYIFKYECLFFAGVIPDRGMPRFGERIPGGP